MATETKTVSIRIPAEMVEYLEKKDMGMNGAIVDCIEKVMFFEKYAMRDIQGVFSCEEWKYIADSLNGVIIDGDFRYISSALVANIEDADKYEMLGSKWNVDVKKLCDKISRLSCSSIDAIYRRAEAFWNDSLIDMEEWSNY